MATRYHEYADDAEAISKEAEFVSSLDDDGLFCDENFDATGTSLYRDPFRPPKGMFPPEIVEWNRINQLEIRGVDNPSTFTGNAEMNKQVKQGALTNCWLVSAMAMLTNDQAKTIMVSDSLRGRGIYTVKFYKEGKWIYVHVDDRVPCNFSGDIYFSKSQDVNEMWVIIVEKAYAKLHGCYETSMGGHIDYALRDLTGVATMKMRLTESKFASMVENGVMWQRLKKYCEDGNNLGLSRSRSTDPKAYEGGMMGGHVYPIVDVCELHADATSSMESLDEKMVRILDPWGMGGWSGDWSSGSGMWADYPDIEKAVAKKIKIPNTFWMSWVDVLKNFNQIFAGISFGDKPASRIVYRGGWIMGDVKSGAGGNPHNESFPQNPQYSFSCNEPTQVCSVVSQTDLLLAKGMVGGGSLTYNNAIGMVFMKLTGTKSRSTKFHSKKVVGESVTFAKTRSVSGICELQAGRYVVVPCGTKADREGDFMCEIFSDKVISFENNGEKMSELDEEESDDEELGASEKVEGAFDENEDNENEDDDPARGLQSLMTMASDLAKYIQHVGGEVKGLEKTVAEANDRLAAM